MSELSAELQLFDVILATLWNESHERDDNPYSSNLRELDAHPAVIATAVLDQIKRSDWLVTRNGVHSIVEYEWVDTRNGTDEYTAWAKTLEDEDE